MDFEIHKNFHSKIFLIDLTLCRIFLENERHYPWIILVPRRSHKTKIMDLSREDQLQLLSELDMTQHILWNLFKPTQINVAAIGNKTPQLHIHIIARFENDPAWPGTVWDHSIRAPFTSDELNHTHILLKQSFLNKKEI